MPASWEIKAARRVLCGILHVDTTSVAWAFGLRNLDIPGQVIGLAGMPFDMARNVAARQCLDGGFEYLFFLDSDVVAPRDTIPRLIHHRKPLISGMYCRRSPPHGVPVMIKNGQWVTQFPLGQVIEVDYVGAGCLLIHRRLVEMFFQEPQRPGNPMFDWRVHLQGILPKGECLSEDFTMCLEAKRRWGIPTLVDTSIQCRHIGFSETTLGNMLPCNASPVT